MRVIFKIMEVQFSPEIVTRLQEVAVANGKAVEELVKDTVETMLERRAQFIAGVERGIAAAKRGDVIDHEDVVQRMSRLFES